MKYLYFILFFLYQLNISSQNVGISDQLFTPQTPLHIYKSSNGNLLQLSNSTSANTGLIFELSGGINYNIINKSNGKISFYTNNTERFVISNSGYFGIGTTDPKSTLHINGSFSRNAPVTKTGNFTLGDTENWIIVNNSSANTTITLPSASAYSGREVTLKNLSNDYTVISNASNVLPIDGTSAGTSILPAKAGSWVTLVSNGTNWVSMKEYIENGSSSSFYLGQDTLGGIVFHIYLDENGNQSGLIVSKTESGLLAWQNTGVWVAGFRTEDGKHNYDLMSDSPAKDWVEDNLNVSGDTSWYIPSIDELILLMDNRFHAQVGLRAASATLITDNYSYWSSTQNTATTAYYCTYQSAGSATKTGASFRVRAIKKF